MGAKLHVIMLLLVALLGFNVANAQTANGKFYFKTTTNHLGFNKQAILAKLPNSQLVNVGLGGYIISIDTLAYTNAAAWSIINNTPGVTYVASFYNRGKYLAVQKEQVIVKLNNPANLTKLANLCNRYGVAMPQAVALLQNTYTVEVGLGKSPLHIAQLLMASGIVDYAEPEILFTPVVTVTPNDPLFFRQWALANTGIQQQYNGTIGADMKVTAAWTISGGSPDVKIGIMDSGVDTLHPDLMPNMLPGFDANTDSVDTKGYPTPNFDEDGHGTCCAGICAAVMNNNEGTAGVAPFCKIVPIRMFYYLSFGGQVIPLSSSLNAASGISWAWQNGVDILSNSWGVPDSLIPLLGDPQVVVDAGNAAIANGRNGKGMLMLYSSGNDNSTTILLPARYPEVISVNATSMCDERKSPQSCDNENWGGNYGDSLDVSAPGVKIATTDMLGTKGFSNGNYYNTFNGTSAACPNAAGVMALILSINRNLTHTQARYILENTADRTGGYDYSATKASGSWSYELGYGRVNAYRATVAAQGTITGIGNNLADDAQISIYYDADGNAYLNLSTLKPAAVRVELFDIMGRYINNIHSANGINQLSNMPIQLSAAGIYVLRININGKNYSAKVVKK